MPECSECGEQTPMPFQCKFCEESFCSRHRLPENHDCEGLRDFKDRSREEGKIGYEVGEEEEETAIPVGPRQRAWKEKLRSYLPRNATMPLLGLIFAVFVLQVSMGLRQSIAVFGLAPGKVVSQPYRLVTSIFMHGGLAHLLVNSIVLWSFGRHLENVIGTRNFLKVLLTAGFASSVGFAVSGYFFGIGPAVGISGGLYGLVTLLAVIRPEVRVLAFFFIPLKIRQAIGFFAAMDLANFLAHSMGAYLPLIGGFASAGHLSGLLTGLAFGYLWKDRYRRERAVNLWRMVN
ncbi:MAG: rhomboid family intramembrane serine protease [Candidatus Nanohaloarchaea archaeon]|nr:rhomboid family intramembrane serine protease [Candidatus Nanohaloarchaea archaeon]